MINSYKYKEAKNTSLRYTFAKNNSQNNIFMPYYHSFIAVDITRKKMALQRERNRCRPNSDQPTSVAGPPRRWSQPAVADTAGRASDGAPIGAPVRGGVTSHAAERTPRRSTALRTQSIACLWFRSISSSQPASL